MHFNTFSETSIGWSSGVVGLYGGRLERFHCIHILFSRNKLKTTFVEVTNSKSFEDAQKEFPKFANEDRLSSQAWSHSSQRWGQECLCRILHEWTQLQY